MGGYYDNGKGSIRRGIADKDAERRFKDNYDAIDWGAHRKAEPRKPADRRRRKA